VKRYLAIAAFAAFIACTIGVYYVQASLERLPQFRLATLDGDAAEGKSLVFGAIFRNGAYSERLEITDKGSRYESERSWLESTRANYDGYRRIPSIDRLIDQFPNFMRGNPTADYQDEEWLVRLGLTAHFEAGSQALIYGLNIDILDKTTKRSRTLKAELPQEEAFNGRSILDVQRAGSTLKVAIQLDAINGGNRGRPEVRVYDVDGTSGQVLGSTPVEYGMTAADNQEIRMEAVTDYDWTQPSGYLALDISVNSKEAEAFRQTSEGPVATAYRFTQMVRQLTIYEYATGVVREIPLPAAPADDSERTNLFHIGDYGVQLSINELSVKMSSYRLADAKLLYEKSWANETLEAESRIFARIAGPDRLSLVYPSDDSPNVVLVNPTNGEIAYRGAVTLDGVQDDERAVLLRNVSTGSIYYVQD